MSSFRLFNAFTALRVPSRPAAMVDPRAEALAVECIRLQYDNMPTAYIASGVLATVVAAIYQHSMPLPIWLTWLVVMYVQVYGRYRLRRQFVAARPPAKDMPRWGRRAVLGTMSSGVLWGIGTVLGMIYSHGAMQFLIVPLVLLFSVAAAISAISYLPIYYAFLIPSTLPGIVVFWVQADELRLLTGIAYLCFVLMVTRFAHVLHQSFLTSTRLRFENSDLVEALRAEKAAAEEANRAKSRFLAAASHDLRQPMHALSLFIASFPTHDLSTHQAELIANMRKSADAMGSLFDSLLDMSRLDAGTVQVRPEHFDATQFGARLYREFSPLAMARGLRLRLHTADVFLYADPILLKRIVANLLSNAVRYGGRVGVLLAIRPRQQKVAIEVWDTGVGISEADQRKIFQEFVQVGNSERDRDNGLGLGLAIVERLARLTDAQIEVRSRLGVGSMFRVLVPLGQSSLATAAPANSAQSHTPTLPQFRLSVIVIDDEQAVRSATLALLTLWGCRAVAASSAQELIESAPPQTAPPDLILADLRLRDSAHGIDAITQLRNHFHADIPGVVITGDTMPERLQMVRDSGLPILHKPLQPDKLCELLAHIAQRHGHPPHERDTRADGWRA